MNPTVVLASGNRGKLADLGADVRELLNPILLGSKRKQEENGASFLENALIKARSTAIQTGLPALADDSGLMVDALAGAPGIHSARYAGEDADDARNNALLLERLQGVADRGARFCCVLVLMRWPEDPFPLVAQGAWSGSILEAPRGDGGFGYDPLFLDAASGRSAAELSRQEKARVSHRGAAVRALDSLLDRFADLL